jgi:hypothetical protein
VAGFKKENPEIFFSFNHTLLILDIPVTHQRRKRTVTLITVTHQASNTFISLTYMVREERLSNTN